MSKTLYVKLVVVDGMPEVQLDRDVWGDKRIRWRKADLDDYDNSVDFDFVSITDLPPEIFETTKVTNSKINVKDKMKAGIYAYTITVRYRDANGDWAEADSTEHDPIAEGGKPVIRN